MTSTIPTRLDWSAITDDNTPETPTESISLPPLPETKKRGRTPLKKQATVPVQRPVSPAPTPILQASWLPDVLQAPETYMPTSHLMDAFDVVGPDRPTTSPSSRAKSPKIRKSVNIEEEHHPNYTLPDEGRNVLISLYNDYFVNPLKKDKHTRQRRIWTPKNTCAEIKAEIDAMDMEVNGFNPGKKLADTWAGLMTVCGEPGLVRLGYNTTNLGKVCQLMAKDPLVQEKFNRLLVKYPILRKWVEMGNWPEIELFMMMAGVVKMVHDKNVSGHYYTVDPHVDTRIDEELAKFQQDIKQ